jgi:antitoxin component of MazEF toxin-antitoxin module
MLTKKLTKIGDSTGIVIDKPLLDLLGLSRSDDVELTVENQRLIIRSTDGEARAARHQAKFEKARARVDAKVGTALKKLAK